MIKIFRFHSIMLANICKFSYLVIDLMMAIWPQRVFIAIKAIPRTRYKMPNSSHPSNSSQPSNSAQPSNSETRQKKTQIQSPETHHSANASYLFIQ